MYSHDCSYPRTGRCENCSSDGVSSGSSSVSASSSAFAGAFDDDASAEKGADATPLGLSVSNSVTFVVDLSGMAFLTGGGAGFGGTYYV